MKDQCIPEDKCSQPGFKTKCNYDELTGNVKYADLPEHSAVAQCSKHGLVVVSDDRQLATLHDVHLLAHITLATHEVARTEDGQLQLQDQLNKESGLAVLENGHSPQRVEMYAYGDLRLEFVRQHAKDFVLVEGLLVRPQIVEPLDDALLELLPDFAELHVSLDAVHLLLEGRSLGVHVRDHATDVTDDCSEYEHADEEVCDHEHVLDVTLRSRRLADRRQRQRRPVERIDVHA